MILCHESFRGCSGSKGPPRPPWPEEPSEDTFEEAFWGSLSGEPFWGAFLGSLSGEPFFGAFFGSLSHGHLDWKAFQSCFFQPNSFGQLRDCTDSLVKSTISLLNCSGIFHFYGKSDNLNIDFVLVCVSEKCVNRCLGGNWFAKTFHIFAYKHLCKGK